MSGATGANSKFPPAAEGFRIQHFKGLSRQLAELVTSETDGRDRSDGTPGNDTKQGDPSVREHTVLDNPYLIAMGSVAWDMRNPEMLIVGTVGW